MDTYPKIANRWGELLIHAAGRPGNVGMKMTSLLISVAKGITNEAYLTACKNAIDTADEARILKMAENAKTCVTDLDMGLYGEMISKAISDKIHGAVKALIRQCSPEEINSSTPYLMAQALYYDRNIGFALADKGFDANRYAAEIINAIAYKKEEWLLE